MSPENLNASFNKQLLLVGCGNPNRSMGWFHAKNILEGKVPGLNSIAGIVEPWLSKHPTPEFSAFVNKWGLKVYGSVEEFDGPINSNLIALIAMRTPDVPPIFYSLLEKGLKKIYLEKPGAADLKSLHAMKTAADSKNCEVCVGYARNVHTCVKNGMIELEKRLLREVEEKGNKNNNNTAAMADKKLTSPFDDAVNGDSNTVRVTFHHNNSFRDEQMEECFTRNNEGMLLNMACHDLALAVKFFGLSPKACENARIIGVGKESIMSNYGDITDFVRMKFAVPIMKNINGVNVPVELVFKIDRQGGDWAGVEISGGNASEVGVDSIENVKAGKNINSVLYTLPEDMDEYKKKLAAEPEIVAYLIMQQESYWEYLGGFAMGKGTAEVGLEEAGRVLECAAFLTNKFKREMSVAQGA